MILKKKKWNSKEKKYKPHNVCDKAKMFGQKLTEETECANCNKRINYKSYYESRFIENNLGFKYIICESCHKKEEEEK